MADVRLESITDLEDFVCGCTLYGVGGGGNPAEGLKALQEQYEAGRPLGWVEPDRLPGGTWVACAFLMGSTAPLTDDKKKQMVELGLTTWRHPRNLAVTTKRLEDFTGKRISALVPLELGGSNTPAPVAAAASLGKYVIDGDLAGRAVPEITQTTAAAAGVSFCPASSVDKYGNFCMLLEAAGIEVAERLGKYLSDAAFGSTGLAGFLVRAEDIASIAVLGTLTEALKAGRAIRRARESGMDTASALATELGMYILFRGRVVEKPWEDRDGYYWGTHVVEGEGEFAGQTARVVFKNENHLFYVGKALLASSPDLIMNLDAESGAPLRNEDIEVGRRLTIMGARCRPQLRTGAMLKYLGPAHFGAREAYRPIEETMASWSK